jgi:Carboxypeptidase regulatory-like domain
MQEEFSLDSFFSKKSCFRKASATSILALATLILGSAALSTPRALAQNVSVNGGSIQGTISDPSGASVANASVVIASKETGFSKSLTTDGAGYYSLGPLNPGSYQVTVTAPGFEKTVIETVIRVGTATPGSFRLSVGQSSEQITVNAGAVQVNTDQPGVSGVITSEQIKTLPINGRNFLDLAQLEPGVQLQSGSTFDPTKVGFSALSVNGISGRTTRILLDGQDITDENVGTTMFNVAQGSVGEFQINHSTQDVSGELTSTGQVLVSTGSGTNTYHGQLFYNFQDHSVGFATVEGIDVPFQRNQFGGAIGGPIIKDKLFFFADSERIKQDSGGSIALSPTFASVQAATPFLNTPYRETYSAGRLDYNGPFNGHYFVRVNYDNNSTGSAFGLGYGLYGNRDNSPGIAGGVDFATGRFTHSFRISYEKFHNLISDEAVGNPGVYNPLPNTPVSLYDSADGLYTGPNYLAPQQTYQSDKQFRYDGAWTKGAHNLRYGAGFNRLLGGGFASFFGLAPLVDFNASSFLSGAADNPLNYKPTGVTFGNGQGYFSEVPQFGLPGGGQSDWRFSAYVGDSWRAMPKLNISAGIRYERDTLRANQDLGVIPCSSITASNFSFAPPCSGTTPLLNQWAPGLGDQVKQPNLNVAPQIGFVYSPDTKTSIRGGFGVYYDSNVWNNILFDRENRLSKGLFNSTSAINCKAPAPLSFPGGVQVDSINGQSFAQVCAEPLSQSGPAFAALQTQYQQAVATAGPAANPDFVGQLLAIPSAFYSPNYVSPYSLQMNLGVQREVVPGMVLSVDYIHSATLKIQQTIDVNHVGAARYFNKAAAQNAVAATLAGLGEPNIQSAINDGATIDDFRANGLDSGLNVFGGVPAGYGNTVTPSTGAAFPGANPGLGEGLFNFASGKAAYDALQVNLRQQKTHPFPGFDSANFEASYSYSRILSNAGNGDQQGGSDTFFTSTPWNQDNPTQFIGRAGLDSTNQLSFGGSFLMKWGPRIGLIGHFRSANPTSLQLDDTGGQANIFQTDTVGDGQFHHLLPGTDPGYFGHQIKTSNLKSVIANYNATEANTPTPAGQVLLQNGIFSSAQLEALQGVQQPIYNGSTQLFSNPMFKSIDASVSYPIRLKWLGEGRSLEPAVQMYNAANFANWGGFSTAGGSLINVGTANADPTNPGGGAYSYVNGTNGYDLKNQNRVLRGDGTYDQGGLRSTEFQLKFNF